MTFRGHCWGVTYLLHDYRERRQVIRNRFRGIGIRILEQFMGARNRVEIGLSYWPARLHRLAELIPPLKFKIPALDSKLGSRLINKLCTPASVHLLYTQAFTVNTEHN
jgi:hypothetical protein